MSTQPRNDTNNTCCGPDCCPPEPRDEAGVASAQAAREQIRQGYAEIAKTGRWSGVQGEPLVEVGASLPVVEPEGGKANAESCAGGGCCGPTTISPEQVAAALGYSTQQLASLPSGANLGLSCGNPTELASLREGERVLDLGSGGGLDCFLAGRAVGATGHVIGVDMTPEMVARARKNLATYRTSTGLSNIDFRLGEIEHLPVANDSIDVVLSNCVLNLSTEKQQVWREIARVLAPGGRVAVSDIALFQPLPDAVRSMVEALVGCVAGAALVSEIEQSMRVAGLVDIVLTPKPDYVAAMSNADDPLFRRILELLPPGSRVSDYVTSLDIRARKS